MQEVPQNVDLHSSTEKVGEKPARRTQAERSSETIAKIIAATVTCIDQQGYANTTFQRVAREAGVTVGAVQHYFHSKTELLLAVINNGFADLSQRLDLSELKEGSLDTRIDWFIDQMWAHCSSATYQANVQILLGFQHDNNQDSRTKLNNNDSPLLQFANRARAIWMDIFDSTHLSEKTHAEMLHFVFASIGGSAQLYRISKDKQRVQSDLLHLKKLLRITFEDAERDTAN